MDQVNLSPTSQARHLDKLSPTPVTNIDFANFHDLFSG